MSQADHDHTFPVVIIGAGIAGLSAAAHLAAKGIPPLILESDLFWAGGRLSGGEPDTFEYEGQIWSFKPDHGVHALWGGYDNMRALFDRFLDVELQPSPGEEWINRWGREVRMIEAGNAIRSRWLPAPFHYLQLLFHPQIWSNITPLDFLSLPGYLISMLLTVGFDPIKEKNALDGLLMADYFRGWTPNLKATFVGLGQNLLAAPTEEIDLSAYIAALRFYTILRRDSWTMSYFPSDSHTSLIQPLMTHIEAHGGCIRQGVSATHLQRVEQGWRILVDDAQAGGQRSLFAEQVILATNAPSAERLLLNGPDTAKEATQLKFPKALRNIVVRLWFKRAPREGTPGGMLTGDFEPDNFFWLHRLYDDCRAWHDATGGSVVELHFYAYGSLLEQPDRNLIVLAVSEIQRAFPNLKGHFVHGVVRRNSKVHTRFRVPTRDSLHVQTPWHNISACGDWVGYDSPAFWMERATLTGIAAANTVLQACSMEAYPILQPREPERLVQILGGFVHILRRIFTPVLRGLGRGWRRLWRNPSSVL